MDKRITIGAAVVLLVVLIAALGIAAGDNQDEAEDRQERLSSQLLGACDELSVASARLEEQMARLENRAPDLTVPAQCR